MRSNNWIWVLAAIATIVGVPVFVALMVSDPLGPHYTSAEQSFLNQLHHGKYLWSANDDELVRQGHQVCRLLDNNGGNEDALEEPRPFGYGSNSMPGFMQEYNSIDQRHELVLSSTVHFCNQYTLYIGDVPI